MLNSVGLANPGLAHVRAAEMPWLLERLRAARVLVNVVGFTLEEYAAVIEGLDDLDGITAYELNLSCPNTAAGGIEFGADPASVSAIIARCRRVTKRPLVAKLSPVLPDIAGMAVVARDAGADGVSVVNTLPGLALDAQGVPRLGNGNGGVSGPALLPAGVLAVRRVRERAGGLPGHRPRWRAQRGRRAPVPARPAPRWSAIGTGGHGGPAAPRTHHPGSGAPAWLRSSSRSTWTRRTPGAGCSTGCRTCGGSRSGRS